MIDPDKLRALDEAATPVPWAYRPDDMDDWGIVKSPRQPVEGFEGGLRCCLAQFRHPEALDEEVLNAHRRAKTDPWRGNAELTTYLRNAVPAILAMAEREKLLIARVAELEGARVSSRLPHRNCKVGWKSWNCDHGHQDFCPVFTRRSLKKEPKP